MPSSIRSRCKRSRNLKLQATDPLRKRVVQQLRGAESKVSTIESDIEDILWQQYQRNYDSAEARIAALEMEYTQLLKDHSQQFYSSLTTKMRERLPRELRDHVFDCVVHEYARTVIVHRPGCSCRSCKALPGPPAIEYMPLWLCNTVYTGGEEDITKPSLRVEIVEAFFRSTAVDAYGALQPGEGALERKLPRGL